MNIFVLSLVAETCARSHTDRHVVKMIVESAQLLCGVYTNTTPDLAVPYKLAKSHVNHPCSVWARKSFENYSWLLALATALCAEYTHRYKKTHKTQHVIEKLAEMPPPNIPSLGLTAFAMAMPVEYRCEDEVEAYMTYYRQDKRHLFKWKERDMPEFLKFPFLNDIKDRRNDEHTLETTANRKRKHR